jgi:hypothetical protein
VNPFWKQKHYRWMVLTLIFGIGPLFFYIVYISPATLRISDFRDRVKEQWAGISAVPYATAKASDQELKQLESIKRTHLFRVKIVDSREALLRFSGTLADALASGARSYGLHVIEVDFQNALIRGSYLPENNRALDALTSLPSVAWNDIADPLDIPMLKLPSIEIQMMVSAEYSKVFSFIEALPEFPVPVKLTGLSTANDSNEQGFRLKIRGYYFAGTGRLDRN